MAALFTALVDFLYSLPNFGAAAISAFHLLLTTVTQFITFVWDKFYAVFNEVRRQLFFYAPGLADCTSKLRKSFPETVGSIQKFIPKKIPFISPLTNWVLAVGLRIIDLLLAAIMWVFSYGFVWVLLVLITMTVGVAFIAVEEAPVELVFASTTLVSFFETLANIVIGIIDTINLVLNLASFSYNAIIGGLAKLISLLVLYGDPGGYQPAPLVFSGYANAVVGGNGRSLQNDGALGQNNFLDKADDVYAGIEVGIQIVLSPVNLAVRGAIDNLLFIVDIFLFAFAERLQFFLELIRDSGKYITCCFTSIEAFGVCFLKLFIGIIVAVLQDLFKFFGIDITTPFRTFLGTIPPGNTPCTCAGFIPSVGPCPGPRYICEEDTVNGRLIYVEYRQTDGQNDRKMLGQGFTRESGCPRFIASRNTGRLLQEVPLDTKPVCEEYCYKDWKFNQCTDGKVEYQGSCSRTLTDKKSLHEHLNRFLAQVPQSKTTARLYRKSKIFDEIEKQFPNNVDHLLTLSDVQKVVDKIHAAGKVQFFAGCELPQHRLDLLVIPPNLSPEFVWSLFCFGDEFVSLLDLEAVVNTAYSYWPVVEKGRSLHEDVKNEMKRKHTDGLLSRFDAIGNYYLNSTTQIRYLKELMDHLPQKRSRKLDPAPNIQIPMNMVPCGNNIYKRTRAECPVPSKWTLLSSSYFIMNSVMTTFDEFDVQQTIARSVDCWKTVIADPTLDPTNSLNLIPLIQQRLTQQSAEASTAQVLYCFPTFQGLPYIPFVAWDAVRAVNAFCAPRFTQTTGGFLEVCYCPLFEASGLFDSTPWTTFLPNSVRVRFYNGIMAFTSLINLTVLGTVLNAVWYPFFTIFTPSQEALIRVWDVSYTSPNDQEFWQTVICAVSHIPGSGLFTITFLLYPLITFMFVFFRPVRDLITTVLDPIFGFISFGFYSCMNTDYKKIYVNTQKKLAELRRSFTVFSSLKGPPDLQTQLLESKRRRLQNLHPKNQTV